jgi:uncharacterized protein YjbI with pentapeptide repeats
VERIVKLSKDPPNQIHHSYHGLSNYKTKDASMKKYTAEEIKEILELHRKWRFGEDGGSRANLRGADLCGADLCGADLCGADLCGANLRGANLCDANLRDANLCGANLCGADLCGANLCGANLCDANLCGANLMNLTGNRLHVKTIALEKYTITYTAVYLQIGCQRHTFEEWMNFDDEKIGNMDLSALEWWKKWKEIIFKLIEMSPAEPTKSAE